MNIIRIKTKNLLFLFLGAFFVTLLVVYLFRPSIVVKPNITNFLYNQQNNNPFAIKTKCDYGRRGPRILCAIFTHKEVHKKTLMPVHETWASRLENRNCFKSTLSGG